MLIDPADQGPFEEKQAEAAITGITLKSHSLWRDAFRQTLHIRSSQIGLVLLGFLLVLAVFAPLIAPYDPNEVLLGTGVQVREGPCIHLFGCDASEPQHILGIDGNGRDEFSRIVYGARLSLLAGLSAVAIAVDHRHAHRPDGRLLRAMVRQPHHAVHGRAPGLPCAAPGHLHRHRARARAAQRHHRHLPRDDPRVRARRASQRAHRSASRTSWPPTGPWASRSGRILHHRVLPNALTPLVVQATLGVATAVLEVAALSFLGLGVQPPTAEWGSMLASERNQVFTATHLVLFPGIMIMINVLAFNLIGDGLRDALDPRLNR